MSAYYTAQLICMRVYVYAWSKLEVHTIKESIALHIFLFYDVPTATIHVDQCLDVAILVARYNIVQVIGEQQLIITLSLQHRESIL